MHQARFFFRVSEAEAARLREALSIELEDGAEGTKAAVSAEPGGLHIDVDAQDLPGLRATLNGALRLLDTAVRTDRASP